MKQHMETTTSALPERILYLCTCVAWAAKGDLEHLETAVPQALDHGVTINELKDAFAQLYAYAGFPRSLNALGVLEKIQNAKMVNGLGVSLLYVLPCGTMPRRRCAPAPLCRHATKEARRGTTLSARRRTTT